MAATSTETNLTTTETMVAPSTSIDPSSTSSIQTCTRCETVQPTSTGFNMFYESPPLISQSAQLTASIESERNQNTSLPSCIPSEESPNTDTTTAVCTDARSSLSNFIDRGITSAAVLPTSTCSSRSFEPSQLSPRGSSLIDLLKNCPKDLGFNVFLDELAAGITNEDLKRLKQYVIGENGIGYGTLEKIETALEFFTALRKRNILTRDNIIVLQVMLWHLKRRDLHRKCVEYAISGMPLTFIHRFQNQRTDIGTTSNECIQSNFRGKLEDREEILERLKRAETWLEQREKEVIELRRLLDKAELDLQKVKNEKEKSEFSAILTFQTQRDFTFSESSKEKANESKYYAEDRVILLDRTLSLKPIVKYKHVRHKSCNWI